MSRTLVVVSCYRDLDQLCILLKSANKYLEPSKIIVIINEDDDFGWLTWCDRYGSLLTNHNVSVIFKNDILPPIPEHLQYKNDGWIIHQVLKLIVALTVTTDQYVLLDSKNFFIRKTSLNNIKQQYPVTVFDDISIDAAWISAVASKLNVPLTKLIVERNGLKLRSASTPYVITTKYAEQLIAHFGGLQQFVVWFLTTAESVLNAGFTINEFSSFFISEFYLYELYCSLELDVFATDYVQSNNATLWSVHKIPHADIDLYIDNIPPNVYVGGIHREYISQTPSHMIEKIYKKFGL